MIHSVKSLIVTSRMYSYPTQSNELNGFTSILHFNQFLIFSNIYFFDFLILVVCSNITCQTFIWRKHYLSTITTWGLYSHTEFHYLIHFILNKKLNSFRNQNHSHSDFPTDVVNKKTSLSKIWYADLQPRFMFSLYFLYQR